jgi:hypothetical protein
MTEAQSRLNVPATQSALVMHNRLQGQEHSSSSRANHGGNGNATHKNKTAHAHAHVQSVQYTDDQRLVGAELTAAAIDKQKEDPLVFSMFESF